MNSKPTRICRIIHLAVLLLMVEVGAVQAQYSYITNADGSIYTYATNADGSANIAGYSGPPWVVTVPTNINGLTVTSIGYEAFIEAWSLSSVTIPSTVTSIQDQAFSFCRWLTNVTIPDSVTNIGGAAFYYCPSLTSLTIPESVVNIGGYAFYDCWSLASVTIPSGVTEIGDYTFYDCGSLNRVTIPESVVNIGGYTFYDCWSLVSVTIPSGVTNLGNYAFGNCGNLARVYFQGNAPTIGMDVFQYYSPTVYYLPGTTGWSNFSATTQIAAVLWNPVIQAGASSFGVSNGQFGFNITGNTNLPIVVEACTNLVNPVWTPVQSMTLTNGSVYFSDPNSSNYPVRYYGIGFP